MSIAFVFWLLMLLAFIFRLYNDRGQPNPFNWLGNHVLTFILLALLGWAQFGAPVK